MKKIALILASGRIFWGRSFGKHVPSASEFIGDVSSQGSDAGLSNLVAGLVGEVVFNTAMSGYVEVLSDPSFFGQLVCMTYPHIGNYGVDKQWIESGSELTMNSDKGIRNEIQALGFIVKEVYQGPIPEGRITLDAWMKQEGICGISGVDTRALTTHLRDHGAENGVMVSLDGVAEADLDAIIQQVIDKVTLFPHMQGRNLVDSVGLKSRIALDTKKSLDVLHVGILDLGCKHNIIRLFEQRDCNVTLFNDTASAEEILSRGIDMVLVSNGPGDPATLMYQKQLVQSLIGKVTLCGICLGTQLLALSIGAETYKLPFGHHGINHPVKDVVTHKLLITSQNHGFAVDESSLPHGAMPWFVNTNDHTLEGFRYPDKQMYSVQFHPEAAPGPTDSLWVIDYFIEQARKHKR